MIARKLNAMSDADARAALGRACGAARWVDEMLRARPFDDDRALFEAADRIWASMMRREILEAFSHHPRIGDRAALAAKFTSSAKEQAGVASASEEVLTALEEANARYEAKFGHVFLVCATGKSAPEMLAILGTRMLNAPDVELRVAAAEHAKITRLRLEKI